jgi:uncharacterized membrane protein
LKTRPALAAALALAFPALMLGGIWLGLDRRALALALAALALWRWGGLLRGQGLLLLGLAAVGLVWLALVRSDLSLKAYPICVNLGLLVLFGQSLWRPPTFVERLARLSDGDLDEAAVRYTRRVTQVWCVFFIVNAGLSLAAALFASERVWALYTGGISYVLMGLLFGIEWLVRQRVRRKAARPEPGA